jgi:hypothetical protein
MNKGMDTYYSQDADRQAWHTTIAERRGIVLYLQGKGICPENPHNMKMKALRELYADAVRRLT